MSGALFGSAAQAGEVDPNRRAGFDGLSREMSTCATYYSLLAAIIENADGGPAAEGEVVQRIKSTAQAMLVQSITVANQIGIAGNVVTQRVQASLKEMVDTVNGDPVNSLEVMQTKYGQPCDELLQTSAERFAELLEHQREDF
jgi:hypothetical protein